MSLITIDCIELNAIEKLIHAGAKRLIFSLSFVSARPCCCLDLPQLREAIDLVHKYDCEAAINFTRFFMEEELNVCEKMLLECHRMNADIFYFTDMCVLQLAQLHGFADKCIYDPQTLITNASDAQFYLDEGIHGVTVSNQITLEEICEIGKNTKGNCEVMIHGRMLMMHSKRRLLSSYFEFVHMENKADSKDLYLMEENREERMPIYEDDQGTHVYSGTTLCSFQEINQMKECGIQEFRISPVHMSVEEACQILCDYQDVLAQKKDGSRLFEEYKEKYPQQNISTGFLHRATSLVKES